MANMKFSQPIIEIDGFQIVNNVLQSVHTHETTVSTKEKIDVSKVETDVNGAQTIGISKGSVLTFNDTVTVGLYAGAFTDKDGTIKATFMAEELMTYTTAQFYGDKSLKANQQNLVEIYYSVNGKDPKRTKTYLYTGQFKVNANLMGDNTIIKAVAYYKGVRSDVAKFELRIKKTNQLSTDSIELV